MTGGGNTWKDFKFFFGVEHCQDLKMEKYVLFLQVAPMVESILKQVEMMEPVVKGFV